MKEIFLDEDQAQYLEKFTKCVYTSIKAKKLLANGSDYVRVYDTKNNTIVKRADKNFIGFVDNLSLFYYDRLTRKDGVVNLYMREALKDAVIYIADKVNEKP